MGTQVLLTDEEMAVERLKGVLGLPRNCCYCGDLPHLQPYCPETGFRHDHVDDGPFWYAPVLELACTCGHCTRERWVFRKVTREPYAAHLELRHVTWPMLHSGVLQDNGKDVEILGVFLDMLDPEIDHFGWLHCALGHCVRYSASRGWQPLSRRSLINKMSDRLSCYGALDFPPSLMAVLWEDDWRRGRAFDRLAEHPTEEIAAFVDAFYGGKPVYERFSGRVRVRFRGTTLLGSELTDWRSSKLRHYWRAVAQAAASRRALLNALQGGEPRIVAKLVRRPISGRDNEALRFFGLPGIIPLLSDPAVTDEPTDASVRHLLLQEGWSRGDFEQILTLPDLDSLQAVALLWRGRLVGRPWDPAEAAARLARPGRAIRPGRVPDIWSNPANKGLLAWLRRHLRADQLLLAFGRCPGQAVPLLRLIRKRIRARPDEGAGLTDALGVLRHGLEQDAVPVTDKRWAILRQVDALLLGADVGVTGGTGARASVHP